ncbi:MAG: tRNA (adenosine(37)-N6)-dimethylallyltransferase MiaA [Chlamydiae bacterium]|nr:tRNA (adenosine(37)-N6)-dimethylallyltransferase MiaA [Chlamydiota bacterium]MBI3266539.1 tRNA (adenosine(37)-N6)-dimethylallyltransferase MiaA [Chlamydiota bacterium]
MATHNSRLTTHDVLYLVGPTAVGKSAVALKLASKIHAEIIVADSMQVYRGLDIGTAKPTFEERQKIPHHLLDVAEISEEFNVAHFVSLARLAIREIQDRSHIPLLVGGTGLYVKALIDGLFEGPSAHPQIRERLGEEARRSGKEALYDRLKKVDPLAASKMNSNQGRRIIRALEVYEITGSPISSFQTQWNQTRSDVSILGLERERADLYSRIDTRIEMMFEKGLVEEVQSLVAKGLEKNRLVMQAIGYKETLQFLKHELSLEEAKEKIKLNTRHFAKRQWTWFKKDARIRWFHLAPDEEEEVVERILDPLGKLED